MCVYSHIVRQWHRRARGRSAAALAVAPLFADDAGCVVSSSDMDRFVTEAFAALGLPEEDAGGASARIGGASDIRAFAGVERGRALITERGRWASKDIGWIYQRGDIDDQLELSAGMARVDGRALEDLIPGWAQPAQRGR